MPDGEGRFVVGIRHDNVHIPQPILHTRICQESVTFPCFEILQTYATVKAWHVELPVEVNSVPARTPKQVVGMAIHSITIAMDRSIEPVHFLNDESFRYEHGDGTTRLMPILMKVNS